jgi:hypothetical protein
MRVLKGKAVGNTVVLEEVLPEGVAVDVIVYDLGEEAFALTEELRKELREASAAMKRDEAVDLDDVLGELERL